METDEFWHLIETARSQAEECGAFDQALVGLLAARSKREILEYQERFDELHGALYRWDVWAAAYLIGGGCSDDSFVDFRAGVIAQGRGWYEQIALNPDDLAEHPLVVAAAAEHDVVLFYEVVNYSAPYSFKQLTGEEDFYEAWEQYWNAEPREEMDADMGEDFDFDDAEQMHRCLPRLAVLYRPDHPA
ncbi:DUF4240 domain-containing protein [Streptomyces sp. NPDC057580]|uniref:DUF4240 domain-containing protein n=1 Tax=Streptomyces sp. NPDC057580 TaxID=3346173 RepID=UPI0036975AD2